MTYEAKRKLADNLYKIKLQQRMSNIELSTRTGLSRVAISKYLNCQQTPTLTNLGHLARALGCNVADLLQGITTEELL